METTAQVQAVHRGRKHQFSKQTVEQVELVEGLGVRDDAHLGVTVQHVYQKRANPSAPNLRQVHLLPQELFDALRTEGFAVLPGELGENITTVGIDLVELPRGTLLYLGQGAVVEVTGLRNPCTQIEKLHAGLLKKLVSKDAAGHVIRKAGIMGVVQQGGFVGAGDLVTVVLPEEPFQRLNRV